MKNKIKIDSSGKIEKRKGYEAPELQDGIEIVVNKIKKFRTSNGFIWFNSNGVWYRRYSPKKISFYKMVKRFIKAIRDDRKHKF